MAGLTRAFSEFLSFPTSIIVGFLVLASGLYAMERAEAAWLMPLRDVLEAHVFADPQVTADILGTIVGSLIAVASITISLLLIALQQTAASISTEVFDQFLRRRHNQFYFGFFVGVALYALVTLATVNAPFNPVIAASLAVLLTIVALFLLIVLLYTTINQMRPVEIVDEIHRHALAARDAHLRLLERTRRTSQRAAASSASAYAASHGYITRIDLDALEQDIGAASGEVEIVCRIAVGSYVSTGDLLADISCDNVADAGRLAEATCRAMRIERQRDIASDPTDGIEELAMIGWTSIATAKSNPPAGLLAIRALRDLLAQWSADPVDPSQVAGSPTTLPIVYTDTLLDRFMEAFESLAVVSSESMQHQSFAEVARALAVLYPRLPVAWRPRAEQVVPRILSALGDHVLTTELENALVDLTNALRDAGSAETAAAVETARVALKQTVGHLHSRSTRVR